MRLVLLTCLVMIAFAANSVLNRWAVFGAGLGPASVALLRVGSGAVVLLGLTLTLRGASALRLRPSVLGAGAATLFLYLFGFSIASGLIDAGLGALTLFGSVQITMFAGALIQREPISRWRWIGAGLAFSGLVLLLLPTGTARVSPGGFALMALNGRRIADPLAATALNFALATPLAALWLVGAQDWGQGEAWGIWPALASGAITSGLGYALWYRVLPELPASFAAIAQLSVPLLAALGGALVLAEWPQPIFWISAALVLGGIGLSLKRR